MYLSTRCSSAITKVHCRGRRCSAVRTCIIFLQRRPIFWMGVFCLLLQNQVTTSESLLKRILWLGCHRSEFKKSFEENLQHQAMWRVGTILWKQDWWWIRDGDGCFISILFSNPLSSDTLKSMIYVQLFVFLKLTFMQCKAEVKSSVKRGGANIEGKGKETFRIFICLRICSFWLRCGKVWLKWKRSLSWRKKFFCKNSSCISSSGAVWG